MRVALRLGVLSLSCVACETVGWDYNLYIETSARRPAVHESTVQVFWLSPPDAPFDVLGTMAIRVPFVGRDIYSDCERLDQPSVERRAVKAAAKRGADVLWLQRHLCSEYYVGYWDDPEMYRARDVYVEGVFGRRRE